MGMIAAILTFWIVLAFMVWVLLPRPTAEERAAEDAEFVAQYCRRKGGTSDPF